MSTGLLGLPWYPFCCLIIHHLFILFSSFSEKTSSSLPIRHSDAMPQKVDPPDNNQNTNVSGDKFYHEARSFRDLSVYLQRQGYRSMTPRPAYTGRSELRSPVATLIWQVLYRLILTESPPHCDLLAGSVWL